MKIRKKGKGEYGYLKWMRLRGVILTFLLFLVSCVFYFAGVLYTGSNKNLLTIFAVLGMLPACQSFIYAVLYFRAKGTGEKAYQEINQFLQDQRYYPLYDLCLTSYEKNFDVECFLFTGEKILILSDGGKALADHVSRHLAIDQIFNMPITVCGKLEEFLSLLQEAIDSQNAVDLETQNHIYAVIYAISL